MPDTEIRTVNIGAPIEVSVKKRADGSAQPRVLIAGVPAKDIISLVGEINFYHQNEMRHGRVDEATQVADAISRGAAEIGIVSEVPHPLQEGVGVLLTIEGNGAPIALLGKVNCVTRRTSDQ